MSVLDREHPPPAGVLVIRVAVVDSRRLIAEALASVVSRGAEIEVVITASGRVVPAAIAESEPDIVLVGVGADELGSLALIDALTTLVPHVRIVIVADVPTRQLLGAVRRRALGGLLLTDHPAEDLVASLHQVARGRAVLPSGWPRALTQAPPGPLDTLSDRQLEVLRLLGEGCSYEEIGRRLFISVNTVKFHTRSIFERLGVRNRMAAARVLAESALG